MEINENSVVRTVLTYKVNDELFAIDVINVISILEVCPVTKVPMAPPYIKGLINHSGNILPLIDLRIRFGLPEKNITNDTCIIVLKIKIDNELVSLGVQVDSVQDIFEIDTQKIESYPSVGTKYNSKFISGVYKTENMLLILLDLEKFLSNEKNVLLQSTVS